MFEFYNLVLSRKQRFFFIILIFLSFLTSLLEIIGITLIPIFVSSLIDIEIIFQILIKYNLNSLASYNSSELIFLIAISIISIFFLKNIILIFTYYFENLFSYNLLTNLSDKIFKGYLNSNYQFFLDNNISVLSKNISHEARSATSYISSLFLFFRESLILIVFSITIILQSEKNIILFITVGAIIISLVIYFLKNFIEKKGKIFSRSRENFIFTIEQTFTFIKDIIILNKKKYFFEKFNQNLRSSEKQNMHYALISKLPRIILEIIFVLVVITLAFIFYNKNDENNISVLLFYSVIFIRFIPCYNSIVVSSMQLKFYQHSMKIIINELKKIKFNSINLNDDLKENNLNNLEINSIECKNVSFEYPSNSKKIIDKFNLKLTKNTLVGVIGKSGSGKTTLLNLLLGLLKPTSGNIIINDKLDLLENLSFYRQSISFVSQEVAILDDTIKQNIIIGKKNGVFEDSKKLNDVIKMVNLDEFIKSQENKIDTLCGQDGKKISGGQKQRIGIARAIYSDPKIIFLDEATSALDKENETLILKNLLKLKKDKIIFLITHKKSILNDFDTIISFEEDGNIKIKNNDKN